MAAHVCLGNLKIKCFFTLSLTQIRDKMVSIVKEMKVQSAEDFSSFTSAVIDAKSWKNIKGYLEFAHSSSDANVLVGGTADDRWVWSSINC